MREIEEHINSEKLLDILRAVHSGGGGGGGAEGAAAPARKTQFFFSNMVFEFAELFLVAILVKNHKKID